MPAVAIATAEVEIWKSLQMRLFYSKCGISVTVYARLPPPLLFFLKQMEMSCATRASNNNLRDNSYGNFFFSVPIEVSPILVTRLLGNKW